MKIVIEVHGYGQVSRISNAGQPYTFALPDDWPQDKSEYAGLVLEAIDQCLCRMDLGIKPIIEFYNSYCTEGKEIKPFLRIRGVRSISAAADAENLRAIKKALSESGVRHWFPDIELVISNEDDLLADSVKTRLLKGF